jgi:hypothetical protein
VSWVFGAVAITLGALFLWGVVAPRTQWRALAGWSVSDPNANEPGGAAYAARRLLCGVGALGLLVVALGVATPLVELLPSDARPIPPVRAMWGTPEPQIVNRVFGASAVPSGTLSAMPVLGYQALDDGLPDYLIELRTFTLLGQDDMPGYIGQNPDPGVLAVGAADLVVHVAGPVLCIPRDAVVIETEDVIQVGVFYGRPDDPAAPAQDQLAACPADSSLTGSILLPIDLVEPVGERDVQTLDGEPIVRVPLVD